MGWAKYLLLATSLLSAARALPGAQQHPLVLFDPTEPNHTSLASRKRVAIVGGGTGGVTTLKTLLVDIPAAERENWDVVLFEQRAGVGGVWLPDPNPPSLDSGRLPETPLYPALRTNTPHPTMTIPHWPFRPLTALFPHHESVLQYHEDVVRNFSLESHLRLNSEVVEARWADHHWNLHIEDHSTNASASTSRKAEFDHLIVATGHNHYPYEPEFDGRRTWEEADSSRRVVHSIFFRDPADFAGKNVLVVGGGASGRDSTQQIVWHANSTYVSQKDNQYGGIPSFPNIPGVEYKPRITRLTARAIHFADGSSLEGIDTILLATGYEYRIPFLTRGGHLDITRKTHTPPVAQQDHLTTNLRYIRPVFKHIVALDAAYPPGALFFIGLPIFVANAISDVAQALFIGYALADPAVLPARADMLADVAADEERIRRAGLDPADVGHRMFALPGEEDQDGGAHYQDSVVRFLQERGLSGRPGVPESGRNWTEGWRRLGRGQAGLLRKAWERVESKGEDYERHWLDGVRTEEEWAELMKRLVEWEEKGEQEEGL